MRVLVIGTGFSQFVKEPIERVLLNNDNDVFVTYNLEQSDIFLDFYKQNNINILDLHDRGSFLGRIPKIGVLYNLMNKTRRICRFKKLDLIHIHSINSYILTYFIVIFMKRYSERIVCTVYGSDIFMKTDIDLKKWKKIFDRIDAISIATNNIKDKFKRVFGNEYDSKLYKVPFGLTNLIAIDNLDENVSYKERLGINKDKILISIGHNKCVEQQHLNVLESISKLSQNVLDKIAIVLQLTYGNGSKEYVNKVKESANQIGCDVLFLDKYMNGNEIAVLTKATDYYINSQKSDAMSGAMLEYLYAETVVFNPQWIEYGELKEQGCEYVTYASFGELIEIIQDLISERKTIDVSKNKDIVRNFSHWDINTKKWEMFYNISEANYKE